jgi:DNA-binding SARP family transcriptional activator
LEKRGLIKKAAANYLIIMENDPLAEGACQDLLRLSLIIGNHNEALKAFNSLSRALAEDLKTDPDPKTMAIVKQISRKV